MADEKQTSESTPEEIPIIKPFKARSIRSLLMGQFIFLVFVISAIFYGTLKLAKLQTKLKESAHQTLYTQVSSRGKGLSDTLNTTALNTGILAEELNEKIESNIKTPAPKLSAKLQTNPDLLEETMKICLEEMVSFLDRAAVTGVYVFLEANFSGDPVHEKRAVVYLRDSEPGVKMPNNSDLLLLRGPAIMYENKHFQLDADWRYEHDFLEDMSAGRLTGFYYNPFDAATADGSPFKDVEKYGYWSPLHQITKNYMHVMTYSVPLISSTGEVYGVVGIELSPKVLSENFPFTDLIYENAFFTFSKVESKHFVRDSMVFSGNLSSRFLQNQPDRIRINEPLSKQSTLIYPLQDSNGNEYQSALFDINLYARDSPFLEDRWVLAGVAPKEGVLYTSNAVGTVWVISFIASIMIGIGLSYMFSRIFTNRIIQLAIEVSTIDDYQQISLERTNIHELDILTDVIESLGENITRSSTRLSAIVDMVGITLGGFEIDEETSMVYMTDSLFRLYALEKSNYNYVSTDLFYSLFPPELIRWDNALGEAVVEYNSKEAPKIEYLRVKHRNTGSSTLGIIIDVTDEIFQQQKLQYERNYDVLTGLLNRNSYLDVINEAIYKNPLSVGALIFGDIDNLKFVNDMFGHDIGDRYIITVANALCRIQKYGGVAVRLSGDEFIMHLHGYASVIEIDEILNALFLDIRNDEMEMPDDTKQKVQISFGIAYYPKDSKSVDELIKFADFALYEVKHTKKGEAKSFDRYAYDQKSFLLNKNTVLDTLFQEKQLVFHFQPIVSVETGKIYGYEALMRPNIGDIRSPLALLELAKANFKLPQLETLTRELIFQWMEKNLYRLDNKKIFFNTIPNVELTEESYQLELPLFEKFGPHLVMEITEQERMVDSIVHAKIDYFKRHNGRIAIDDYGAGYSNDYLLLKINPNLIKLDMAFVRDINANPDKQSLVEKIFHLARIREIEVVAEGVETKEELDTLILLGADYIQGYYLARPSVDIQDISEDKKEFIQSLYIQHQKYIGY